ncbi:MAG: Tetratricopeptide repeat [Acidobacteria bacterium]|nr:Tetratricopeptide repeat [Acidobacteriota bacterium]
MKLFMRNFAVLFILILFSFSAFAQKPKPSKKNVSAVSKTKLTTTEVLGSEKEEFDKAVATENAADRISALQKFAAAFPESTEKNKALELIVSARAAIGDEKLRLSETESGRELFILAVKEAPQPVSDKLFSEILLQFPTNLFWRGQQAAALEIARLIEEKAGGNPRQLLGLATFYIGIENAAEAARLANKALALDASMPAAYQTLALAHRVNFQLEESANAYAKALELDPESIVSRRSLAEMKRAVGKPDEAIALYREILSKDENDNIARTGLSLALFDAGKRAEAETELAKSLETNPGNLPLLVGAAYWYAANNDGAKAVELAGKAVELEPRYTWAHIALARGFLLQKRPLDAERTLLTARQYGNFPTLDYELASARISAGFYREAADALKHSFVVKGETVETRLGNRLAKEARNFIELLDLERRASIFQPQTADSADSAEKLKALLNFDQKLETAGTDEAEIGRAADEFVKGDDKMKLHRQLFAANRLLQNSKSLTKALELTQAAVGKTDVALDVPTASAAVLAEELYESRTLAVTRNQLIVVPEVPRQMLSAILRGRIEEITGWTLYQQNRPAEAVIHLKRAVSVLPEKSAWWNSSMWRLGASLQADGKDKEALDAYIKAYPKESPDGLKYSIIESLYQKINGNTDGLITALGDAGSSSDKPLIVAKDASGAGAATPQTAVNASAQSAETQTAIENVPAPRAVYQQQGQIKFPKEVPVKIDAPKPAETGVSNSVPVKIEETPAASAETAETKAVPASSAQEAAAVEEKTNAATVEKTVVEKTVVEKAVSADEKTVSAETKPVVREEKPIAVEEKPVTVEEKPVVVEEKTSVAEEKSAIVEEKPTVTGDKPAVVEEKPAVADEEPASIAAKKSETPVNQSTVENPAIENSLKSETSSLPVATAESAAKLVVSRKQFPPSPKAKTEPKTSARRTERTKTPGAETDAPKPLFEPIVITVPKRETEKPILAEAKSEKETAIEPDIPSNGEPETNSTEKPKTSEPAAKGNAAKNAAEEHSSAEASRPRVIVTDNFSTPEAKAPFVAASQCTIEVGQENISLLSGGGSLGILVGYKNGGDLKQLRAVSASPDDIQIIYDSEIGDIAGRAFFVVKSINTVKGSYKVTFEAPCGKKEILIKVR